MKSLNSREIEIIIRTVTVSYDWCPSTRPVPYLMKKCSSVASWVSESSETYLLWLWQATLVHFADGTHRFAEPVSNITLNGCGGVPMVMFAKYATFINSKVEKLVVETKHSRHKSLIANNC